MSKSLELVLKQGIRVTLRINVDKENIYDISEVLDGIPWEYRSQVQISICNFFQNEVEFSTYELLKQAIEKGYAYAGRINRYVGCHASVKNAAVIDTSGDVLLCSNTDLQEKRMGYINNDGKICIERLTDYYVHICCIIQFYYRSSDVVVYDLLKCRICKKAG